ncbi:hypothetical protein [Bradyrhizobium sp. BTAi1]|jgi:hypothetical protein|uniref:hypothetical protein n=1 Tax=Bradyrhizobium sp. (strain BTAi1 / ATCC BAA-1182) TaxID=288000 RepID=UPI0001519AED|nr:hypothetical protein [Bradyrhizobium sp. BTAi1]ABQ38530.1 putative exported protein of unknown function [Bradyrhizobium sp. BTAi1]
MTAERAKAFAAIIGGVCAIGAAGAASYGYTLAAIVAGGILIVAGIGLAAGLGGEGS